MVTNSLSRVGDNFEQDGASPFQSKDEQRLKGNENYGTRQESDRSGTFRTVSTSARERYATERRQSQREAWKSIYRMEDRPSHAYGASVLSAVSSELAELSETHTEQDDDIESSRKITDETVTMPCASES